MVAQSDSEDISDTSFRTFGIGENGIFGVLLYSSNGNLKLVPYDSTIKPLELSVINGAFSAPSYISVKGKIHAIYEDENGHSFSKDFTKDASNYFLFMAPNATTDL